MADSILYFPIQNINKSTLLLAKAQLRGRYNLSGGPLRRCLDVGESKVLGLSVALLGIRRPESDKNSILKFGNVTTLHG